MIGLNPLIMNKVLESKFDDKTKRILKDLLSIEFMNQLRNNKNYFDQYDDVISKNVGDLGSD